MHWLGELWTVVFNGGIIVGFAKGLHCAIFHHHPRPKGRQS